MKIVLFGSSGQIGAHLFKILNKNHIIIPDHKLGRRVELQSDLEIEKFLNENFADLYINAAAYTNVDAAENNQKECYSVNTSFVEKLSFFLQKYKKPLIHFSSDYVYGNNANTLLEENDDLNPVNYYAETKKIAEEIIFQNLNNYFIFRVSWIYSHLRNNFYKSIKGLLENKEKLYIVGDQIGSPTPATYIAETIAHLINNNKFIIEKFGVYNLSASNFTSWHGFAKEIYNNSVLIKNKDIELISIKTEEYKTLAQRQKNSRLNCKKFTNTFNFKLKDWKLLYKEHEKRTF